MVRTKKTIRRRLNIINFRKENNCEYCSKCKQKISTKIKDQQHHFLCHNCWLKVRMYPSKLHPAF